jgi:O-antigen/teichoic acid export membrane protein
MLLLALSLTLAAGAYLVLCLVHVPSVRRRPALHLPTLGRLLHYGGWVTLSGVLVPIIVYADRFLIGILRSVAAVGYYTAPYEMAARLQVFPWSLATALFPALSAAASGQVADVGRLYARSLKFLALIMAPVIVLLVVFARDILHLWLGGEYAARATSAFQWLVFGMFLNALAQLPANLLDAVGRPDVRAKLFLWYTAPYLMLSVLLITRFGIAGAAAGWAVRGAVELLLFFGVAARLMAFSSRTFAEYGVWRGAVALVALFVAAPVVVRSVGSSFALQVTAMFSCVGVFAWAVWRFVLDTADKQGSKAMMMRLVPGRSP